MKNQSIKMRPFNVGGAFEIVLPNGKVVLIDPYFTGNSFEGGQTREDVTGADYIILTHAHFDHDIDVGYFVEKFGSKVFVGAMSAMSVMKFHKIPYDNLFPVYPGQKFTLPDLTLEFWQAKHNGSGGRIYNPDDDIAKTHMGVEGHQDCDTWGSMESLDVMITTNNHFRILMASGMVIWEDLFDIAREKAPNLLLRQSGVRESGGGFDAQQVDAPTLAQLLVKYHAQVIFPFHQDIMAKRWGQEKLDAYFAQVAQEVEKLDSGAMFVNPKAWHWYDIGIHASLM